MWPSSGREVGDADVSAILGQDAGLDIVEVEIGRLQAVAVPLRVDVRLLGAFEADRTGFCTG